MGYWLVLSVQIIFVTQQPQSTGMDQQWKIHYPQHQGSTLTPLIVKLQ